MPAQCRPLAPSPWRRSTVPWHSLGLADETGSLELGKSADLAAVDLNSLHTQPVYHPISQLVYAAGREQVSNVWVAGRRVVNEGEPTTLDRSEVLARAAHWRNRISVE